MKRLGERLQGAQGTACPAIGQIAIDTDVAKHERPGIGVSVKLGPKAFSNRAVRAVAAHQISRLDSLFLAGRAHDRRSLTALILCEALKSAAALDLDAASLKMLTEHPFGFVLRNVQ